ncbi:MAG TPA: hypothetical protein PLV68_03700, partial [Ilumatobacteraceae bacterium]|nr:hypothetical protein [Ilumatobacteraceae bacterium]
MHYDLALIKTVDQTVVAEGGTVTWTITVKNQGNVDSGPYSVTDTLPGGMSLVSSNPAGGQVGSVVTWTDRPNLTPGATATIVVVTRADDMTLKPFRNWAEISADGADAYDLPGLDVEDEDSTPDTNTGADPGAGAGTPPNDAVDNHNDIDLDTPPNDEDDNDYEEVGGDVVYDLALVKVVDNASPVQPGDTITWRLLVKNQGTVASHDFTVVDRIPTGLAYGACTGGASCSQAGGVVTWTVTDLAPGGTTALTYTTTISDVTKAPFRNWAEISSDSAADYDTTDKDSTPDADTGHDDTLPNDDYAPQQAADIDTDQAPGDEDDNDDAVVDVVIRYDLALAKVTSTAVVNPTDQVTWTVRVRNQGNVASGAYTVTDTLPAGMVFVAASHGGTASGRVVTWTMPNLNPGQHVDVTVTTTISDPTLRPFRNWAEISSDSADTYDIPGVRDVEDVDSTPDANTGRDDTLPNDDYSGIDDLAVIGTDGQPAGDEDDNDDAVVDIAVRYDLALIKQVQAGPFVVGDDVTWTIT